MPPPSDRSAALQLLTEMGAKQDDRIDSIERRLLEVQLWQAESRGAASGLTRLAPWVAMGISLASLVWSVVGRP